MSRDAVVEAVQTGGAFNVIHVSTAIKVVIFVAGSDLFDRARLRRRISVEFPAGPDGVSLFVDTAEDTILRKLEWYRRGGEVSERQWRDVAGIIGAQSARLDRTHLRTSATTLGVVDLLERALATAGG